MATLTKKVTETEIQNTVCEYLERKKHFFSRINTTPIFDATKRVFRKMPKYTLKGFPDIIVYWNGFPVHLEIKALKGVQSPEQKEFQRRCELQAIEYHIIRKLEDVINIGL